MSQYHTSPQFKLARVIRHHRAHPSKSQAVYAEALQLLRKQSAEAASCAVIALRPEQFHYLQQHVSSLASQHILITNTRRSSWFASFCRPPERSTQRGPVARSPGAREAQQSRNFHQEASHAFAPRSQISRKFSRTHGRHITPRTMHRRGRKMTQPCLGSADATCMPHASRIECHC